MIGQIRGLLIDKQRPTVIVEANGVGYEIDIPMTTLFNLPELNKEVTLFTHLVVREDIQQLYGFLSQNDKSLFRTLIKVNGIGAKMALAILSSMDTQTIVNCITMKDVAMLTQVPGIGKKTAERMILDMQDKLKHFTDHPTTTQTDSLLNQPEGMRAQQDAISALQALGYKAQESHKIIKTIYVEGKSSEALIKEALKSMIKGSNTICNVTSSMT